MRAELKYEEWAMEAHRREQTDGPLSRRFKNAVKRRQYWGRKCTEAKNLELPL